MRLLICLLVLPVVLAIASECALLAQTTNGLLNSFEMCGDLAKFTHNNTTVTLVTNGVTEGEKAAQVVFSNVDWPNIYFRTNSGFTNADWRAWGGIAVDILNTNTETVTVAIRVDDDFSADGVNHCQAGEIGILAGEAATVVMPFSTGIPPGMKGGPLLPGALTMTVYGVALDWSHIVAFQIFLPQPGQQRALILDNLRLVPLVSLTNLVDRYGQYTGSDWPGKVHQDADFAAQDADELEWLAANPRPADRDVYGAWKDGPLFPSTGFFRTAFVLDGQEADPVSAPANQGRWWMIAPSGRLFFSLGVDVINYGETTVVTGRDDLFTWLPSTGDPLAEFSPPRAYRKANFYGMNLYRKYGTNWNSAARDRAFNRLDVWGFNTIGNWSQSDLYKPRRVPYTVPVGYSKSGLARFYPTDVEMVDVFDPAFATKMAAGISSGVSPWKSDPWCVGYFVENELPWSGWGSSTRDHYAVPIAVLAASSSLPSKTEFTRLLQAKYASIAELNTAWNTSVTSWDQVSNSPVTLPATITAACVTDLSAFLSNFARVYFSVVSTNMQRFASNQLYLGCRFASRPTEAVDVAAEYCDVVSLNIYVRSPETNTWAFTRALNKPCLIGEFHFGALDRGMFDPGLVEARDQADRGRAFQEYLRSVLSLPAFVGCHWFQYEDEPLTGRFDGENGNIGLVSGTDTPYWELIVAARQTNAGVYLTLAPTAYASAVITTQPASQTNYASTTATFSVVVTGTAPLQYQWKKDANSLTNGGSISGVTGASLTLTPVVQSDAGSYTVVVTNGAGAITSAVATLTVLPAAPAITSHPQSVTNSVGTTATFTVMATGIEPRYYYWGQNGTYLPTPTSTSILTLTNVQPTNAGNYWVSVRNAFGAVTSTVAALTVIVPPSIASQPQSQTMRAGATAELTVTAAGTEPLQYQWCFNQAALPTATNPLLPIPNAQPANEGTYTVLVTNLAGAVTSSPAALVVGAVWIDVQGRDDAGLLQLRLTSEPEKTCEIWTSTNLVDWTLLSTVTNITGADIYSDMATNEFGGYYRLKIP